MSARRGSLTLTRLFVKGDLPRDPRKAYLSAVRLRAFEPLDPDGEANEASGWCVLDRPFDLEFDLEKLFEDRYLVLGFRIDRYRVPAAMLRAQLLDEEQRLLARSGKNRVSRNERLELRDKLVRRLRKKVAPSTRALDVVWDLDAGLVQFFSHSKRALADFSALFERTFRLQLTEDSPYLAAERAQLPRALSRALDRVEPLDLTAGRKASNARSTKATLAMKPTAKGRDPEEQGGAEGSQEPEDELFQRIETTRFLGPEFLLWIWVRREFANASLSLGKPGEEGEYEVWLDRQITLESPLDKNERVSVRGMAPTDSDEAREAVRARKLPVSAHIVFQSPERDFSAGLNALRFEIASAKVPAVLGSDPSEAFTERMALVTQLFDVLDNLYRCFLLARLSDTWKDAWQPSLAAWAEGRTPAAALLQKLQPAARARRAPADR